MSVRHGLTVLVLCLATADLLAQEPPAVRDVTPSGVNRVYQHISPSAIAPVVLTEKFATVRMQNDGSVLADGRVLRLKGVNFPGHSKICGQPGTARWACGMRAHGAARLALELKILECEKTAPGADPRVAVEVTCWIDRRDFALMLLERGWVYPADNAGDQKSYATAAAAAQANKLGLWGDGPQEQAPKPKRPTSIP